MFNAPYSPAAFVDEFNTYYGLTMNVRDDLQQELKGYSTAKTKVLIAIGLHDAAFLKVAVTR